MRLFLLWCGSLLVCATARGELYVQEKSLSPDGTIVFAINYPPTHEDPEGCAQGCFLHAKSGERIGDFFFLPDTDAESDHPGTYEFSAHSWFDYLWSADSTRIAVTLNRRRWSRIYPFRLQGSAVQRLDMPSLFPLLNPHLAGTIRQSINAYTHAKHWTKDHRLVALATQEAQATSSGDDNQDWKTYELEATVAFARSGTSLIKATSFHVQKAP